MAAASSWSAGLPRMSSPSGENGQDLLAQFAQRCIAFLGCQTLGVGARLLALRRRLIHVHRFDPQHQAQAFEQFTPARRRGSQDEIGRGLHGRYEYIVASAEDASFGATLVRPVR